MGKHITILDEHMCVKEKNNTNNLKPINISCGYQKKGNSWLVKVIFCYLKFKKISCGLVANSVIFLTMRVTKFGKKSHLSNVIVFLWVSESQNFMDRWEKLILRRQLLPFIGKNELIIALIIIFAYFPYPDLSSLRMQISSNGLNGGLKVKIAQGQIFLLF